MRSWVVLGGLFTCAACAPTDHAVRVPRLVVAPESVMLDELPVGVLTPVEVEIDNVGTGDALARIVASGDVAVASGRLRVAVGSRATLALLIEPATYVDGSGAVSLRTDYQGIDIAVAFTVATDLDGDGVDAVGAGGTDCDDDDASVFPGAFESCNGVDDDCNGTIDDVAVPPTWHRDLDKDGYGDPAVSEVSCERPSGWVEDGTDCDDLDMGVFPGAPERDNLRDDDCDGLADEHLLTRGDLVFSEVLSSPPSPPGAAGAFVEIANASARRVPLLGLSLSVGAAEAVLGDHVLRAGEVALVCGDADAGVNGGLDCVEALPASLAGSGEVWLAAAEQVLDEVVFATWAGDAGASWEATVLDPDGNDDADAWCVATAPLWSGYGTPGDASPSCF